MTYFHDMQIGLSLQSLVAELDSLLVVADLHRIYIEPNMSGKKRSELTRLYSFIPRNARTCVFVLCLWCSGVQGSPDSKSHGWGTIDGAQLLLEVWIGCHLVRRQGGRGGVE